jgi:hypothetical protein
MLLFTRAKEIPVLASCLCKSYWSKPLLAFVKVVEECVMFNFAIDCKVHFSLEIQRKSILNTASANCFHPATPERALARRHARATPTRRTRAARARRGTGGPIGPCAAPESNCAWRPWALGRCQVAVFHSPACQPPLAIWPLVRRTSPRLAAHAARAPATWLTPGPPNRPSATINNRPQPLLHPRVPPPELHRSAIGAARCKPPSRWHPHPHKPLSSSLCTTKAFRVACRSSRAARSPEPELPWPPPDHHCLARPSADSPSPGTCLASSLGHMEASGSAPG